MGQGISLICECRKKESITLGLDMMYPDVFEDALEDISNRVYGNERWRLYKSDENVVVDAGKYLFYCEECGHWDRYV